MQQEDKTRELQTAKISGLLWKYAIPSIISMVISSIYNIVDRIFIGQGVGALAIAGLAITFPMMNIIHAMGSLIGVGSSARMSIVLGQKDERWAEKILGNSTIFTFLLSGLACTFAYIYMDKILIAFGATPETVGYAHEYMVIVLPGMFMTTLTFNLTGLMRASGYPNRSMLVMVFGAVLNVILDAVFIYGLHLGIAGAAWATTITMTLSAVLSIIHFLDRRSFIRFKAHAWTPKFYIFRNITLIGMSPFLMNLAAAGVVAILNAQLIRYGGDLAVGAYGILNSYMNFMILFVIGLCQGMQPIAGYNYGAGLPHRLKEVYLLTMKVGVITGFIGMFIGVFCSRGVAMAFTKEQALIDSCVVGIKFLTILMPVISFTIVNSNFFQSIDKPWIAIVTSLSRQIIFLVPLTYIVPWLFAQNNYSGLTGIWLAGTISDLMGGILTTILLFSQRKIFTEPVVHKQ